MQPTTLRVDDVQGRGPPGHRGTRVYSNAALPAVPDSVNTLLTWDTVYYDTVSAWSSAAPERITVPFWASWVKLTVHIKFETQATPGAVAGFAACNPFRNGGNPALNLQINLSNLYTPNAGGVPFGDVIVSGSSGWLAVLAPGEYWSLNAYQNTGQPAVLYNGTATWFDVEFSP